MSIIATINRAKIDFMSRTGKTPTHVLLSPEAADVADEVFDREVMYRNGRDRVSKRTILGLEIFYVDNMEGVKVALL